MKASITLSPSSHSPPKNLTYPQMIVIFEAGDRYIFRFSNHPMKKFGVGETQPRHLTKRPSHHQSQWPRPTRSRLRMKAAVPVLEANKHSARCGFGVFFLNSLFPVFCGRNLLMRTFGWVIGDLAPLVVDLNKAFWFIRQTWFGKSFWNHNFSGVWGSVSFQSDFFVCVFVPFFFSWFLFKKFGLQIHRYIATSGIFLWSFFGLPSQVQVGAIHKGKQKDKYGWHWKGTIWK